MLLVKPLKVKAEQRSAEWYEARFGRVTGSMVSVTREWYKIPSSKAGAEMMARATQYHRERFMPEDVMEKMINEYPEEFVVSAGIELGEKAERMNYRRQLVTERLTRMPPDQKFLTPEMRWGIANEEIARGVYQSRTHAKVTDAVFTIYRTIDNETNEVTEWMFGASSDGDSTDPETGEMGVLEIKNLKSTNHLYKIIMENEVPDDYHDQIQTEILTSNALWCDFIGYDSRVPEGLKLFIHRVERDDFFINWILLPSVKRFLKEVDADEAKFYAIQKTPLEKRYRSKDRIAKEAEDEI